MTRISTWRSTPMRLRLAQENVEDPRDYAALPGRERPPATEEGLLGGSQAHGLDCGSVNELGERHAGEDGNPTENVEGRVTTASFVATHGRWLDTDFGRKLLLRKTERTPDRCDPFAEQEVEIVWHRCAERCQDTTLWYMSAVTAGSAVTPNRSRGRKSFRSCKQACNPLETR